MSGAAALAEPLVLPSLEALCDQQFWLFGSDIRRPAGNLLLQWGFERQRQGGGRPTRYLSEGAQRTIALWGFGMLWISAAPEAVFLSRDGRLLAAAVDSAPRVRDAWQASRRLRLSGAGDPHLGAEAFAWIAGYERWAAETAGPKHRGLAIAGREACCDPEEIADAWEGHARELRRSAETGVQAAKALKAAS